MRRLLLLAVVLQLGGCSCGRQPPVEAAAPVPSSGQATAASDPAAAERAQAAQALADNYQDLALAASTLHSYLAAVAGKDWNKADTFWTGGKAPPRPDDYAVRGIEDLGSMRITNRAPEPLDQEIPTRAVEIPVTLLVRGNGGAREIKGWYRLRRKIDGAGWEITSASMPPSLD